MKVLVKENIIYTTNQLDRHTLKKGYQELDDKIYNILKNNTNIEIVKEGQDIQNHKIEHTQEEKIKYNDLSNKIEHNDLDIENRDVECEVEVETMEQSRKNKNKKY